MGGGCAPQPPRSFFRPCRHASNHMKTLQTHRASIVFANGGGGGTWNGAKGPKRGQKKTLYVELVQKETLCVEQLQKEALCVEQLQKGTQNGRTSRIRNPICGTGAKGTQNRGKKDQALPQSVAGVPNSRVSLECPTPESPWSAKPRLSQSVPVVPSPRISLELPPRPQLSTVFRVFESEACTDPYGLRIDEHYSPSKGPRKWKKYLLTVFSHHLMRSNTSLSYGSRLLHYLLYPPYIHT